VPRLQTAAFKGSAEQGRCSDLLWCSAGKRCPQEGI